MDNIAYSILASIEEDIIKDDLDRVLPVVVHQLAIRPQWPVIGKQLFCIAVKCNSYKIIGFMIETYQRLLSENGPFKISIFQLAIEDCNAYAIELFLGNDVHFNSNVDDYSYDLLIENAFKKLHSLNRKPARHRQPGNIIRSKRILKCLVEYPHNRYNQHGIFLEYDEATSEVTPLNIERPDLDTLINGKTLLEIWIHREIESFKNGYETLPFVQSIISSIPKHLIQHVAVRQSSGIYVSPNNLLAINSTFYYRDFGAKCRSEVERMLVSGVTTDRFISIFHILTADRPSLKQYIDDTRIWKLIFDESFVQIFPIYGPLILKSVLSLIVSR